MDNSINELQQSLFVGLHDFHTNRTAEWLAAVRNELGDGVLQTIREKGIDTYGLYRWHLERTLSWLDALEERFGQNALSIVIEKQRTFRREQGAQLAAELGKNTLEDIIPFFSHGKEENIIRKDSQEVLVKSTGCLAGRIACDINRGDTVYALHCALDKDFTEGFNCKLGCEVVQTLMDGRECCIHRIYVKECGNLD